MPHRIRMVIRNFRFPLFIALGAVILMTIQPLAGAEAWSRVRNLKSDTWVYIISSDDGYHEGRFIRGDAYSLTVKVMPQAEVTLARDLVLSVAVDRSKKRHWYSIPLAIIAGAGGGYAGYRLADSIPCVSSEISQVLASGVPSSEKKGCSYLGSLIIAGSAIGSSGATYMATNRGSSEKVIYTKPKKSTPLRK
jgi:hypothetical protein